MDDFASMREVVTRRYRRLLEAGGPFPDLILIDGGKGQLSAGYEALESLGLASLVAVGIAKKEELLFTRDQDAPIALREDSPALLLIRRIRDEAHRFAVTFHRASRTKRDLRSELDAIGGIGPRRRKALLTAFGSVSGVRRATREELVRVVGTRVGRRRAGALLDPVVTLIAQRFSLRLDVSLTPPSAVPWISPPSSSGSRLCIVSLTIHEAAHAWTADQLGDPTARQLGRVSLNPLVHIDPIGTILLPLISAVTRSAAARLGQARPGQHQPSPASSAGLHDHRGGRADQQRAAGLRPCRGLSRLVPDRGGRT